MLFLRFWYARTIFEKRLLVITALLLICVIALSVVAVLEVIHSSSRYENTKNVCLTEECVNIAAKLLTFVNKSADPCEDFYEFSCGTFMKTTNIPDEKQMVSTITEIEDLVLEQLRTVIEMPIQESDSKALVLSKKYYKACIDTKSIDNMALTHMQAFLAQFGDWPVVRADNWNEAEFDWVQTIGLIEKEGFNSNLLMSLAIGVDSKNSSKRIITIDEADLAVDRPYLTVNDEDEIVQAYYSYMVDVAVIFGANEAIAKEELWKSLKFEMELANMSLPNEGRQDPWALYNTMTLADLERKYKFIPWTRYINLILAPHDTITPEEVVSISVPEYITDLEKLLKKTPKRVVANYLLWRIIDSSAKLLTKEIRERRFKFQYLITGQVTQTPRWIYCIDKVSERLDVAVGALYIRNYFPESAKKSVEDIIIKIQDEFKEILQKVTWMDSTTKNNALNKLASMRTIVAYPSELHDYEKLNEFYDTLEIDSRFYLRATLNITKFYNSYTVRTLRLPVNTTSWIEHAGASIVNAFYQPSENSISFPAGILQGIFFHENRPNYINYGGIGYTAGHEITHGFDNEGRHYDANGNMVNWWDEETTKSFNAKTKCIIDQYNNYTVPEVGLQVSGVSTLPENIADIGGIKEAYFAYEKFIKEKGEEKRLPALNYSNRQMFWISAGVSWCTKYRTEALKRQVLTDDHAPERYRVWGPVRNMPEFARDFKCNRNTKMNPDKKCYLW
ncbi:Nep2 [Trypoxylus dichotomus]